MRCAKVCDRLDCRMRMVTGRVQLVIAVADRPTRAQTLRELLPAGTAHRIRGRTRRRPRRRSRRFRAARGRTRRARAMPPRQARRCGRARLRSDGCRGPARPSWRRRSALARAPEQTHRAAGQAPLPRRPRCRSRGGAAWGAFQARFSRTACRFRTHRSTARSISPSGAPPASAAASTSGWLSAPGCTATRV